MDTLTWSWRPAGLGDIDAMIDLSRQNFESEVSDIFVVDPQAGGRNLAQAMVTQHYQPLTELVSVAEDQDNRIIAWTWARATDTAPWSDQRMVLARMAAVDMTQSARTRVQLTRDMLALWEGFAQFTGLSIICSSSMREDHRAFMRIHQQNGYTVRGSNAYKKLTKETK